MRRACSTGLLKPTTSIRSRTTGLVLPTRTFSITPRAFPRAAARSVRHDYDLESSIASRSRFPEELGDPGPSSLRRAERSAVEDVSVGAEPEYEAEWDPEPPAQPPRKIWPPNEQYVGSWSSIGVPPIIARRLLKTFPHIQAPTPAQRAFLLSIFRGKDVFLRDHMGRGKTLAISIAIATLAYRAVNKGQKGIRIVVLLPSTHMVHQVEQDMLLLDPSFAHPEHPGLEVEKRSRLFTTLVPEAPAPPTSEEGEIVEEDTDEVEDEHLAEYERIVQAGQRRKKTRQRSAKDSGQASGGEKKEKSAPILLATPRDLLKDIKDANPTLNLSNLDTVFVDEPDSMLPTPPSRHLTPRDLAKHPLNRHPPNLVYTLNHMLNLRPAQGSNPKAKSNKFMDYDNRNMVQTVWTSGTLDNALRRLIISRAWVRRKEFIVDLDFTATASERQIDVREQAMRVKGQKIEVTIDPVTITSGVQPDHYALTVDPDDGDIDKLLPSAVSVVPSETPTSVKGSLLPSMIEALALLHTSSPPPRGTYALAVPPEGVSLDELSSELTAIGIPSLTLRPETLHDVSALAVSIDEQGTEEFLPPILVARRSAVPGIHLPKLHTIYLIEGLDLYGNGRKSSEASLANFYEILAGRVGRLGTDETGSLEDKQRIISLVTKDSVDEKGLGDLFFGKLSAPLGLGPKDRSRTDDPTSPEYKGRRRFPLKDWDLDRMGRMVAEAYREG